MSEIAKKFLKANTHVLTKWENENPELESDRAKTILKRLDSKVIEIKTTMTQCYETEESLEEFEIDNIAELELLLDRCAALEVKLSHKDKKLDDIHIPQNSSIGLPKINIPYFYGDLKISCSFGECLWLLLIITNF